MAELFGGSLSPRLDLMMQLATVGPVLPDAALGVYGPALLLKSPRVNGGIVPLAIQADCALALANITLRIRPTWSDGSVGAGVLWTPFTAANTMFRAGILVSNFNSVPQVPPAGTDGANFCDSPIVDLTAFFKHGVLLTQLAFACRSSGNADTASITVTYRGLYT